MGGEHFPGGGRPGREGWKQGARLSLGEGSAGGLMGISLKLSGCLVTTTAGSASRCERGACWGRSARGSCLRGPG